ncbi:hypothetical protein [Pseudonocardia spinosispora]|uniref:hypothetical protein n=1 Tax=Pseudonocardia spinosispora TaxID=103441 RepID=UPI0004121375|nr:hypothetical protein [Pseudonocardia spinosispora]
MSLEHVRTMLAAAGIPASDTEITTLATQYPTMRTLVDQLYTPPEVRYADPALRFTPEATITPWP